MGLNFSFVFVLGLVVQASPPLPGQTPATTSPRGGNVKNNSEGKKTAAAPPATASEPAKPIGTNKNGGDVTPKDTEYSVKLTGSPVVTIADKAKARLDYIFDWGPWVFSLLLVGIGIMALIVTNRQADLMETQAQLLRQQATLMDQQFTLVKAQWIEADNWTTELDPAVPPFPISRMRLCVDILNTTSYPITLREVSMEIGPGRFTTIIDAFIPPRKHYRLESFVRMTSEHIAAFETGYLIMPARGYFCHYGPLGKDFITRQPFSGILQCGDHSMMHYQSHMNPKPDQQDPEKQPPN